jgi:hypothetical protein
MGADKIPASNNTKPARPLAAKATLMWVLKFAISAQFTFIFHAKPNQQTAHNVSLALLGSPDESKYPNENTQRVSNATTPVHR